MKYTKTLTIEQLNAMTELCLAGFKDYHRESQNGRTMTEKELNKATEVSKLLARSFEFICSPEFKEVK